MNGTIKTACGLAFGAVVLSQILANSGGGAKEIVAIIKSPAAPVPAPQRREVEVEAQNPSVTLQPNSYGHFLTRATVNNADIDVMIDTGASMLALTYEDAERLDLRPSYADYKIGMSTANGIVRAAAIHISTVQIGQVYVHDVDAVVMPQHALAKSLLGMTFLRRLSDFHIHSGQLVLTQ